ncbi:hypothetical protein [Rhizobium viscosum]|uniref:Uncharacterized protein n=1 Tax=Rhizobium viscosum TaxID=1673 RepID=A0ABR9J102_RHIVS|nr:hypothetical protein [Rhizobium viscosum]MBE1509115.1 hypothetical protein [Rhizobium viscosum]
MIAPVQWAVKMDGDEFLKRQNIVRTIGATGVNLLPSLLYTSCAGGDCQIASPVLPRLIEHRSSMLIVERFWKADILSRTGR